MSAKYLNFTLPSVSFPLGVLRSLSQPVLVNIIYYSFSEPTSSSKYNLLQLLSHEIFCCSPYGPRTLQQKLKNKLLSSIHTTAVFHNCNYFFNSFIYGSRSSQQIFWKTCCENCCSVRWPSSLSSHCILDKQKMFRGMTDTAHRMIKLVRLKC